MTAAERIRIMIVDDSAVMRSLLRSVIVADAALEVAGTAGDGSSALGALETIRPDLILLDVEMPVMDGLATLRQLRGRGYKMPVIMCSSLTQRGAKVTLEALSAGASDYVAKPAGQSNRDNAIRALSEELLPKIHALAGRLRPAPQTVPHLPASPRAPIHFPAAPPTAASAALQITAHPTVVVIGASTGGPAALDQLLPALPGNFPLAVLVVQHMPEVFTRLFAERLNHLCHLPVNEGVEGDPILPGTITIARGNRHLEIKPPARSGAKSTLHLSLSAPEHHCRPSVDVLFRSAAHVFGSGVLAVMLTGMGSDGMNGCRVIRERGGSVLAQDEASSTVWGMPGSVAAAGLANKILPLNVMAPEILRIAARARVAAGELRGPERQRAMNE